MFIKSIVLYTFKIFRKNTFSATTAVAQRKYSNTLIMGLLSIIMFINALSYGMVFPLLYPYASIFGIGPVALGMLFMSYALAQFLATPVIGRLSDIYGRKPLLLMSLLGTSISLALFALAWSAPILFLARILDGITGGNVTVAQAVVTDNYSPKERARGFGYLGGAFGFGFLFGPAIGGLMSGISLAAAFWFAAVLALIASVVGYFILPETLSQKNQAKAIKSHTQPLFDIPTVLKSAKLPIIGSYLVLSFLANAANTLLIIGFQAFAVDVISLSITQIGIVFTGVGLANLVMQGFGIAFLLKAGVPKNVMLITSLIFVVFFLVLISMVQNAVLFILITLLYSVAFAPLAILMAQCISEQTSSDKQGSILGINQSYISIGQIFGPALAGIVMYVFPISAVYVAASILFTTAIIVYLRIPQRGYRVLPAN